MSYSQLLSEYIKRSGKTLEQISIECGRKGVKIHPTYISKLRLGNRPAPSESISRALAEVTGGDPDELIREGFIQSLDEDKKRMLEENFNIQEDIDFTLDFLLKHLTVKRKFKNEFIKNEIKKISKKYSIMFEDEGELTPELIKKVLSDNYSLYLKGDLISDLIEVLTKSIEWDNENELSRFLYQPNITYNGHKFSEKDRQLTLNYLDALFSDRKEN